MNQIIFVYESNNLIKNKKIYRFIFIFSIIIIVSIIVFISYNQYSIYKNNLELNKIKHIYKIATLYSTSSTNPSLKLSNNIEIIGLIEIPKINISYPILSHSAEDLLKISVCRFSRSHAKSYREFMYCWA